MGKWAEPELTFGFLAACLPVLPAFIKHLLRTSLGQQLRSLWTQSPASQDSSAGAASGPHVQTIGSARSAEKSRITKVVEMDIEFEELTRESRDAEAGPADEASRASSREADREWGVGVGGKGGGRGERDW